LAAFGFRPEDFDNGATEVWPENEVAVEVFCAMTTQWREGPNGRTGLDYAALPVLFDLAKVEQGERPEVFASLRTLEVAALNAMSE